MLQNIFPLKLPLSSNEGTAEQAILRAFWQVTVAEITITILPTE
jgi:hypothetical protein